MGKTLACIVVFGICLLLCMTGIGSILGVPLAMIGIRAIQSIGDDK